MRTKITLRTVAQMPSNSVLWDNTIHGFNARKQRSETVTFSVFYRTKDQVQRWHKIGHHGVFTPEQARREAARILRAVAVGEDPSAERHALRNSMSISQLCDDYVADMQSGKVNGKKASTIRSDMSRVKQHLKPKLGKFKVATISPDQIEDFMNSLSMGSAKRVMDLLGVIFSYAIKRKLRKDNPVRGIETPPDVKRMRRLSNGEYKQLWKAINSGATHQIASDIFLMLTITGWRSGEVKSLKFSELDLERKTAILGDTKTGVSVRPLSSAAIEIIKRQEANGVYVFEYHGKLLGHLTPHWKKFAMPSDIVPHTLRHSFASLAADLGYADHTISGLLGHSRQGITSRYLHLGDKALIEAADSVAQETLRLMQG
jgi:site-specific recombinase XerD